MAAIYLENVSFRYPGATAEALSQVNLEIPEGSFFALLGPNGAGKTTLLRLLCGRFPCFKGKIEIAQEFRGKNGFLDPSVFGVLLENPGIYPRLSIEEYVEYFAGFYGFGESGISRKNEFKKRIRDLSNKLELPDLSTKMSALSLGNRQKVQLLRSMVPSPRLLILDEPVANLDPASREMVWSLIADWRKNEGGTAIVCSHILAEMESEATDYAIIERGRVLKSGAVASAIAADSSNGNRFSLTLEKGVSEEQILQALSAAGIANASVHAANKNLSDLYRETVNR
ncbi:MAG: ABC transporter ATP-binding protein [Fibrobacter sp.]|nr:ABC transporter ATP-binding protein [Fibrobacter sp.]